MSNIENSIDTTGISPCGRYYAAINGSVCRLWETKNSFSRLNLFLSSEESSWEPVDIPSSNLEVAEDTIVWYKHFDSGKKCLCLSFVEEENATSYLLIGCEKGWITCLSLKRNFKEIFEINIGNILKREGESVYGHMVCLESENDWKTNAQTATMSSHTVNETEGRNVISVTSSLKKQCIYVASGSRYVHILSLQDGHYISYIQTPSTHPIEYVSITSDQKYLLLSGSSHSLLAYDLQNSLFAFELSANLEHPLVVVSVLQAKSNGDMSSECTPDGTFPQCIESPSSSKIESLVSSEKSKKKIAETEEIENEAMNNEKAINEKKPVEYYIIGSTGGSQAYIWSINGNQIEKFKKKKKASNAQNTSKLSFKAIQPRITLSSHEPIKKIISVSPNIQQERTTKDHLYIYILTSKSTFSAYNLYIPPIGRLPIPHPLFEVSMSNSNTLQKQFWTMQNLNNNNISSNRTKQHNQHLLFVLSNSPHKPSFENILFSIPNHNFKKTVFLNWPSTQNSITNNKNTLQSNTQQIEKNQLPIQIIEKNPPVQVKPSVSKSTNVDTAINNADKAETEENGDILNTEVSRKRVSIDEEDVHTADMNIHKEKKKKKDNKEIASDNKNDINDENKLIYQAPQVKMSSLLDEAIRNNKILNSKVSNVNVSELLGENFNTKGLSVANILVQGLVSNDSSLLSTVLNERNPIIIKDTVYDLSSNLSILLLEKLVESMQKKAIRVHFITQWLQELLKQKVTYFMSSQIAHTHIQYLYHHISTRLHHQQSFIRLQGRVDTLITQAKLKQTAQSSQNISKNDPLITFTEN